MLTKLVNENVAFAVLLSISALISEPKDGGGPGSPDVLGEYHANREAFERKAREWTLKYAM